MASVSDTGGSDSDAITRDRIPVFEASADQDGILTIHDHGHLLYDQPISAGTSNVFLDDPLADGEHIFDVRLAADGEEESLAFRVIIDNLGPEVVDTVARPNPDGLIAFYDFDGTLDDTSGHGRMATATSDRFVTTGYQGQGFHFDGTDEHVSLPVNISPSVYPQITIGAWVRADPDELQTRAILSHDESGGQRGLFMVPDSKGSTWWTAETGGAGTDVPPGDLSGQNALWRIGFADPQPAGIYDFAIFEESGDVETYHDVAGNAMDQNRNGRGAEWNEDYRFAVEVLAPDAGNDLLIELDPENDSGRFDSDNITNITSPQFVATLDIDGTLEVDFDNDGTFDYAHWHSAGQHTVQSGELTDGVHTIAARLTTDSGVISTDEVAITIDTAAPQVREFDGEDFDVVLDADQLEIGFDEALAMDSDSVTGTANYEIVTSGGDGIFGNGNDVDLSARINQLTYTPDSGGGRVTIALAPALRGELHRITAIGTTSIQDIAGNHLGGGFDFSIERQIHEDATITLDLPADQDSGVSDTDDLTRIAAPTVAVEVNIAGIIHLYSEDNTVDVTETVPNGGIVSLTVNQALPDGAHTLTADFTPPGGDPVSTQLDLTIDTQSPGIRLEQLGNALWFDGVDDYVATPLNIDQGGSTPGLTFEAWVYPTTDSGAHIVISSDNGGWDWSVEQNGATWAVFNGSGRWDTGFAVDVNQWQHVAAVFIPGTGVEFYKNGQRAFNSGIAYDGSDRAVAIGRNPGYGSYFAGAIDEVRVWNRPRSEAEPAARFSCQL